MVKKFVPLCLVAMAAAMAGCTDPIAAKQDPISEYPQVHVEAYLLQSHIRVQQPVVSRVGAGQLHVDIPIRNLSDSDLPIDYIYYFTDRRGVQTQQPSSRMFLRIPRKGISQISFTSMTPADDFRVEILHAR